MNTNMGKKEADDLAEVRLRQELESMTGRDRKVQLRAIGANPLLRRRYRFAEGELEALCEQAGVDARIKG